MNTFLKMTLILGLAVFAIHSVISRAHRGFTVMVERRGGLLEINEQNVMGAMNDLDQALAVDRFTSPDLDALQRFDPEGFAALGDVSHLDEWEPEYKEYLQRFHDWAHDARHTIYAMTYDEPFACPTSWECSQR